MQTEIIKDHLSVPDPHRLSAELGLVELAHKDAHAEQPASNLTNRFGTEKIIDTTIRDYMTNAHKYAMDNITNYENNMAEESKKISSNISNAKLRPEQFNRECSNTIKDNNIELQNAKKKYRLALDAFNSFCEEQDIHRPVHTSSKLKSFVMILLLILIIVVEGGLNAKFFAEGSDSGLSGGLLYAVIASLINVVANFIISMGLVRYLNRKGFFSKLTGIVGVILVIAVISFMALGVSHLREAMGIVENEDPMTLGFTRLLADPFGLTSLSSWLLFMITIFSGVFAAFEGYHFFDPCVGLSPKFHMLQETSTHLDDILRHCREEIETSKTKAINDLITDVELAKRNLHSFKTFLLSKEAILKEYKTLEINSQTVFESLIGIYRQENSNHRRTTPPAYFDEPCINIAKDCPEIVCTQITDNYEELERLTRDVDLLMITSDDLKLNITRAFEENMKVFDSAKKQDYE